MVDGKIWATSPLVRCSSPRSLTAISTERMAPTNKFLAETNKTDTEREATKKREKGTLGASPVLRTSGWVRHQDWPGNLWGVLMRKALLAGVAVLPLFCAAETHAYHFVGNPLFYPPGNACHGLMGTAVVHAIEKVAAEVEALDEPTQAIWIQRMTPVTNELSYRYPPYAAEAQLKEDLSKLNPHTLQECVPNYWRMWVKINATTEAKKKREAEAKARAEAERRTPHGRVLEAYQNFRMVRFCNEVRQGYAIQYISDAELERAQIAVHAIVDQATNAEPGINTDALWNQAMNTTAGTYASRDLCQYKLGALLKMSPSAVYDNTKP